MKANELRIGNYLQLEGISKPIRVSIIDTTETSTKTKYKPIPITEEWLLKLGFEKHNKEYWYKDIFVGLDDNSFNLKEGIGVYLTDVFYIHQLQNLYFALTGEELTVKV